MILKNTDEENPDEMLIAIGHAIKRIKQNIARGLDRDDAVLELSEVVSMLEGVKRSEHEDSREQSDIEKIDPRLIASGFQKTSHAALSRARVKKQAIPEIARTNLLAKSLDAISPIAIARGEQTLSWQQITQVRKAKQQVSDDAGFAEYLKYKRKRWNE